MTDTETETTSRPISYLKTAKVVVKFVARRSVSTTVATIIHQNTKSEDARTRAQLTVGGFVLGEMVAAKTNEFVSDRFDSYVKLARETKEKVDAAKAEIESELNAD